MRGKAHTEDIGRGREALVVTELPYAVKKGGDNGLVMKIAELVREKKISGIADLEDHSSERGGMRVVITLKRDEIPEVVLNQLYKHTALQTTFGVNMVALVDGVPRTLSLQDVIKHYVHHQREIIVRRTKHELRVLERRVHVLEGLLIALDNLDAIIELIRASRDRENARNELVARFALTEIQASAILDLRLSQLTALEAGAIKTEHDDKVERIGELREILGDEAQVYALIREELLEIADRFGDERRTLITDSEDEIGIEDLIPEQQMVITITKSGYIKSLPLTTYRAQQRGGRGVTGMDMKDGDYIEHLFVTSSHDYLLFFSNRGKVYRSKVYELPEASRTAKGRALVNVLPLRDGERIQSVLSTRDFTEGRYVVFATKRGVVKKTELLAYNTPIKADGIIAINIRDDDELVSVRRTSGDDDILMVSRKGQAVRFNESDARAMGRDTSGVRGMNVDQPDNEVLVMDVARDDQELLVVTENGYGKRTSIAEYRKTKRGAMGVGTIKLTDAKGALAGRDRRPRARRARLHLAERHGAAHRRARDQPLRTAGAGRAADEHEGGRPRVGRRARRRGLRRQRRMPGSRRSSTARRRPPTPPLRRLRRTRPRRTRRPAKTAAAPADRLTRARPRGPLRFSHQRKEVVRISSSSCGTLEVPGR